MWLPWFFCLQIFEQKVQYFKLFWHYAWNISIISYLHQHKGKVQGNTTIINQVRSFFCVHFSYFQCAKMLCNSHLIYLDSNPLRGMLCWRVVTTQSPSWRLKINVHHIGNSKNFKIIFVLVCTWCLYSKNKLNMQAINVKWLSQMAVNYSRKSWQYVSNNNPNLTNTNILCMILTDCAGKLGENWCICSCS